jgi:hypothetical protein
MNWDDPAARGRLIESVGVGEYNQLIQQHFKSTTVTVENGYPIRTVNTRFGRSSLTVFNWAILPN